MLRGTCEVLAVAGLLAALIVGAERARTVRPPGGAHPPIDVQRDADGRKRGSAALRGLARGLDEQGRSEEAALARAALRVAPPVDGDARLVQGDVAGAERAYRRTAMEAPRSASGWLALGDLYLRSDRLTDAEHAWRMAEAREPRTAAVFLLRDRIEIRQGRLPAATVLLNDVSDETALLMAAAVAEVAGQNPWAKRDYERALELDPELRAARLGYARLAQTTDDERLAPRLARWLRADPFDAALVLAQARSDNEVLAGATAAAPADVPLALACATRQALAATLHANRSDPELALVFARMVESTDGHAAAEALRGALAAVRTPRHARIALAIAGWFEDRRSDADAAAALAAASAADPASLRIALERATWLLLRKRDGDAAAALKEVPCVASLAELTWQSGGDGVASPDAPRPIGPLDWLELAAGSEGNGTALAIAQGMSPESAPVARIESVLCAAGSPGLERLTDRLVRAHPDTWGTAAGRAEELARALGQAPARLVPWRARRMRFLAGPIHAALALDMPAVSTALRALAVAGRAPAQARHVEAESVAAFAHARLGLPARVAYELPLLAAELDCGPRIRALSAVMPVSELVDLGALAWGPPRWKAAVRIGHTLSGTGAARQAFLAALDEHPDNAAALASLARDLEQADDWLGADRALRTALALDEVPPFAPVEERCARLAQMGALLSVRGYRRAAARYLLRAAEGGVYDQSLAGCVEPLVDAGELDYAERAVLVNAARSSHPDHLMALAWVRHRRGKLALAERAMELALDVTRALPLQLARVIDYADKLGMENVARRGRALRAQRGRATR